MSIIVCLRQHITIMIGLREVTDIIPSVAFVKASYEVIMTANVGIIFPHLGVRRSKA